jgi:hypothetical protein
VRPLQRRLEGARVCTDNLVETVITCWLVERVASHLFQAAPRLFELPYYNTPLVPMLRDHADAAIVQMHAVLSGDSLCKSCRAKGAKQKACTGSPCGENLARGMGLRGLEDLKNHRDVIGHPMTYQLNRAGVRKFVDAKRHYADVRPAVIWDVHRSIVDAQLAAGASATVLDVKVGRREASVLDCILRLCWRGPDWGEPALIEWMTEFWTRDRTWFEAHPDGQYPRKTDKELDEIFQKWKAGWEESRRAPPPAGVKPRRPQGP